LTQLYDTNDVTEFRNRQYANSKAVLYFIDESTSSLEVLRRSLVFPGIVVVEGKGLTNLMDQLASQSLQLEVFAQKPNNKDVIKLLRQAGNQVIVYNQELGQGWDFAQHLIKVLRG
jgi:hypothetical protein